MPPRIPLPPGASRRRIDRDLRDEILGHIELKAGELARMGLSPQEAWDQACAALGGQKRSDPNAQAFSAAYTGEGVVR